MSTPKAPNLLVPAAQYGFIITQPDPSGWKALCPRRRDLSRTKYVYPIPEWSDDIKIKFGTECLPVSILAVSCLLNNIRTSPTRRLTCLTFWGSLSLRLTSQITNQQINFRRLKHHLPQHHHRYTRRHADLNGTVHPQGSMLPLGVKGCCVCHLCCLHLTYWAN